MIANFSYNLIVSYFAFALITSFATEIFFDISKVDFAS